MHPLNPEQSSPRNIDQCIGAQKQKARIFSIVNQKGGVAKTTSVINIATVLASLGKRVLIVDVDAQGNASSGMGYRNSPKSLNISDVFLGKCQHEDFVYPLFRYLDLYPCSPSFAGFEHTVMTQVNRHKLLKNALFHVEHLYDYILIDCPPALGLTTVNALIASQYVLIPMNCEFFALEGLKHLLQTIQKIRKNFHPFLKIDKVLLTMHNQRHIQAKHIENLVRKQLPTYATTIPTSVRVSEAAAKQKPLLFHDLACAASKAYIEVVKEFLHQHEPHY